MNSLVKLFFDICLLKRAPQEVPASIFLFQLMVAMYLILNLVVHLALGGEFVRSVILSLAELILLLLSIKIILQLGHVPKRFLQTAIAMMGTALLLSIIAVVAYLWLEQAVTDAEKNGLKTMILMLNIWTIVVGGHIFRHALETLFFVGFLVSFANMVILTSILLSL